MLLLKQTLLSLLLRAPLKPVLGDRPALPPPPQGLVWLWEWHTGTVQLFSSLLFFLTFPAVDCSNFSRQRAGLEIALLLIPFRS